MKLSEIRKAYEELSGLLSKYNRQLAFAGIGIVWLFRTTDNTGNTSIDSGMLKPVMCFIISFSLDLIQYLWQSLAWYVYYYWKRIIDGKVEDDDMNEPEWPNVVAWIMLVLKVVSLVVAYVYLGVYIFSKMNFS